MGIRSVQNSAFRFVQYLLLKYILNVKSITFQVFACKSLTQSALLQFCLCETVKSTENHIGVEW